MCLRKLSRVSVLVILAAAVLPVVADETNPWPQVFRDVTDVNVVNIDVFVTDKDGQPATGLAKKDFELLVDGNPAEISNFYAIHGGEVDAPIAAGPTAGEPPTAPRENGLALVFYIDNTNIDATRRSQVFSHLREFLLESWRPNIRVMLATNDRTVEIKQVSTEVPFLAFVALEDMEKTATRGRQFEAEKRDLLRQIGEINVDAATGFVALSGDDTEGNAERAIFAAEAVAPMLRNYAQQRYDLAQEAIGELRRFVDTVGGLPGNKAVVYVGDDLPIRPAEALFEVYSRRVEQITELSPAFASQVEARRFDSTQQLQELVEHANASGVTLHMLDMAQPSGLHRGSAATADGRLWTSQATALEEAGRRESKRLLADGTGGRSNRSFSDFETVLGGIFNDLDNYYAIGYTTTMPPEGSKAKKVEIRVKDRQDLNLRYRSSFRARSADETMHQQTLSALLMESFDNPLEIALEPQKQKPSADGKYFEVPLLVKVPLGKLVLLPQGKEHRAQVSLYVAVRDGRGRNSPVVKHRCPISIPNKEMLMALGRTAGCGMRLKMRGGPHSVAVVVRDEVAGVDSTLRIPIDISDTTAASLDSNPPKTSRNGSDQ